MWCPCYQQKGNVNHSTMQPFQVLGKKSCYGRVCVFVCNERLQVRFERGVYNSVEAAGSAVVTRYNNQEVNVTVSDRGCELEQSV